MWFETKTMPLKGAKIIEDQFIEAFIRHYWTNLQNTVHTWADKSFSESKNEISNTFTASRLYFLSEKTGDESSV